MLTLYPAPGAWADGRIVFLGRCGRHDQPLAASDSEAFQVSGPPGVLPAGGRRRRQSSITSSEPGEESPLVYSSLTDNGDIWSLPYKHDKAKVLGPLQRLTKDVAARYSSFRSRGRRRADGLQLEPARELGRLGDGSSHWKRG